MAVDYRAPVRDMRFLLEEVCHFSSIAGLPAYADYSEDLLATVLEEAGKFAAGEISPLNVPSDQQGAVLKDGRVTTSEGFAAAYQQYVEAGWNSLSGNPDFGGQGLPQVLATAVNEMWHSACMSFALGPMLTAGAIHALDHHGSEAQKALYLEKLISGEWTGTMNLTEPQAGSDLAAITAKAMPDGDHFRISGTKIYITHGDHDLAENIIHLVLARLPDAPDGVKGISLFVVPKRLVNADGSLGELNDLACISLEHKLGIHGSPTAVMSFGEGQGALGSLVGEANRGLEYMFTMMNHARLQVGLQGVSISERAYQQAHWYAHDRVQGRVVGRGDARLPIAFHPDVQRMLASMKSRTEAMRALAYEAAATMDLAAHSPDAAKAQAAQLRVDLLIPVVKAWCTEQGQDIASLGVQVHGGMGYVEETGAAQHLRDARITTIYEGTTAIQANDFLNRKLIRDQGAEMRRLLDEVRQTAEHLQVAGHPGCRRLSGQLEQAAGTLESGLDWVLATHVSSPAATAFGAVPLTQLAGFVLGGWMMGRAALASLPRQQEEPFYAQKVASATFYGSAILMPNLGLLAAVQAGAEAMAAAEVVTG